jgi:hypothetical protein
MSLPDPPLGLKAIGDSSSSHLQVKDDIKTT